MSEQEMIDAAVAAYESGQWGEWLAWLREQGVTQRYGETRDAVLVTEHAEAHTAGMCSSQVFTVDAAPRIGVVQTRPVGLAA